MAFIALWLLQGWLHSPSVYANMLDDYDYDGYVCEPLTAITMCSSLGYTSITLPNFREQKTQEEAESEINDFIPLIESNCSDSLIQMLCAVYAPPCILEKPDIRVAPCMELCKSVREECEEDLLSKGLSWPAQLYCDQYPSKSKDPLCFGPPDLAPPRVVVPPRAGATMMSCSWICVVYSAVFVMLVFNFH